MSFFKDHAEMFVDYAFGTFLFSIAVITFTVAGYIIVYLIRG